MDQENITKAQFQVLHIPLPYDGVVMFTQIVLRPLIFLIRVCLARGVTIDIKPSQLEPNAKYILAPTHGSWLDPLVVMYHVPINVFYRIGPIRVIVLNKVFDSALRPFIMALGSFPAKPHARYRYGLDMAQEFLDGGALLAIFPEGRRNRDRSVKPRRGVAELANDKNVLLIPVHIAWKRYFFGLVPTYKIHIGAPRKVAGMTADQIMDDIYALPL